MAAGSLGAGLAVGFTLILGVHRFWHLAHGAVYVWAAYGAYLMLSAHLPLPAAFVLVPVLAAAFGLLLELGVYRWLRARQVTPIVMLVASIGLYTAGANLSALAFGFDPRVPPAPGLSWNLHVGALSLSGVQAASLVVGLISLLVAEQVLDRTRPGLGMKLIKTDPEMARTVGARPAQARLAAMTLGSALVGWPALLTAVDVGVQPGIGLDAVLVAAVAAIVGGLGSLRGAYLGALLVGVAQTLPLAVLPTQWQGAIVFAILIGFMLVRPTGFFGATLWSART